MAKITHEGRSIDVVDGQDIIDACMELDIPFGCQSGNCGTCHISVKKGMNNLNEQTEAEKEMGLEFPDRLACQCKIKHGEIELE